MSTIDFSIIIPTINSNPNFTRNLVQLVKILKSYKAEIIIVNDNIDNPCVLPTLDKFKNITTTHNPFKGAASARNHGAKIASSEILIFIDDDIFINQTGFNDYLQKSISALKNNCIIQPNWTYPRYLLNKCEKSNFGKFLIKYGYTSLAGYINDKIFKKSELFENSGLASYFLIINKDLFTKINGYNEKIPFAGAEDNVLTDELKKVNVKFYIDTTYTLFHDEINKINLNNWLKGLYNRGLTKKVAHQLGYKNMYLKYPLLKKVILSMLNLFKIALVNFVKAIDKSSKLEFISHSAIKALIALNIYKGYTSIK